MKQVKIFRQSDGLQLGDKIFWAKGMFDRMKGLLGRNGLGNGEGVLLDPCNSVHTFFMKFPIMIIFLSKENKVVKIIQDLRPWRVTRPYFSAVRTLEIPCDSPGRNLRVGDILEVKCIN